MWGTSTEPLPGHRSDRSDVCLRPKKEFHVRNTSSDLKNFDSHHRLKPRQRSDSKNYSILLHMDLRILRSVQGCIGFSTLVRNIYLNYFLCYLFHIRRLKTKLDDPFTTTLDSDHSGSSWNNPFNVPLPDKTRNSWKEYGV